MPLLTNQSSRLLGGGVRYILRDEFTTNRAAGAVNGTSAEPGPGTRNATDVSGANVVIASGVLSVKGNNNWQQEMLNYSVTLTRAAGRTLRLNANNVDGVLAHCGMRTNVTSQADTDNVGIQLDTSHGWAARKTTTAGSPVLWTGVANTTYTIWTVLRNAGKYMFYKDPSDSIIRFAHVDEWDSTQTLYFGATANQPNKTIKMSSVRVPRQFYAFSALASDSFNRANGSIGSTDGAGHAEANSGGSLAWTNQIGAYTIATNVAASSTIDTVAVATVNVDNADVYLRVKTTRAGGNVGAVVRYVDPSNYVYAYHDGTNVALVKRVAGVETAVVSPVAATYAAGAYLAVVADGTAFRLYYNEVLKGSGTIADAGLQTGTVHGLYSTNSGNTFDNFTIFARRGYTDLEAF